MGQNACVWTVLAADQQGFVYQPVPQLVVGRSYRLILQAQAASDAVGEPIEIGTRCGSVCGATKLF